MAIVRAIAPLFQEVFPQSGQHPDVVVELAVSSAVETIPDKLLTSICSNGQCLSMEEEVAADSLSQAER